MEEILTVRKQKASLKGGDRKQAVELYEECMRAGWTIQHAADFINETLGLDCEKSTYYRAYHYDPRPWENVDTDAEVREIAEEILDSDSPIHFPRIEPFKSALDLELEEEPEEDYEETRLKKIAKATARLREERKINVMERAIVEGYARENANKSAVVEVIKSLWNKDVIIEPQYAMLKPDSERPPIYAFGDVHWGYVNKHNQVIYNTRVAAGRLSAVFDFIDAEVTKLKYKEIYIVDLADDIEGSALRVGQLRRAAEDMTVQARDYAKFLSKLLRAFAKKHPDVRIKFLHIDDDNHSQLRLYNTQRNELDDNLQLLITSQIQESIDVAHEYNELKNLSYLSKSEIIMEFDHASLLISHGHRYKRSDDILEKAAIRHDRHINFFLAGHWHSYSHKNKNMYQGVQESLIFAPAITSDTDFSDELFYSSMPGFLKLRVSKSGNYINSIQYLFEDLEEQE